MCVLSVNVLKCCSDCLSNGCHDSSLTWLYINKTPIDISSDCVRRPLRQSPDMYHKRDKKDEEDLSSNPFAKVQKTSALQEARVFNETPVNARKCALILTKILYLINSGETLSTLEATDAFFNMTKLFQSKDTTLRRLVYIGIKELSKIAENVYVVTSSLTTDMNAKDDQCRPAAMRALCQITDATTFQVNLI